jgi:hypothetical protein
MRMRVLAERKPLHNGWFGKIPKTRHVPGMRVK